jgi:PAS domain S-box-containing protein
MIAFRGQNGRFELVNPEWERTTGWTLKEIRERNLDRDISAELFPDPQYRQWVRDVMAASTGEWTDLKVRVKDGRVIDAAATFVRLSDGTSVGLGRDITERKRAEEALRTSERRQHKIAKQLEAERARLIEAQAVAKVGSWETEWPSLEVTWSEQTHRIFETDPSRFHPSRPDFMEFIHPEDRAKVDAAFQASLDKGAPSDVEYRIVMADGRVKVLEEHWRIFRDEDGRPIRLMGTCRDITERKRAEAELRESEARFRLVADSAPVMIWMSGTDKLCTYLNKSWLDFTGRPIGQELGNGWAEGVDPEDLQRCLDTYSLAFDRREAFRMEYHLRRRDGEYRWVLDTGVPRFNPDGSFAGYIGSCLDVTEQRRAEEQLHQAHDDLARVTRVVAMGQLAAAIAHEVNQPLTAIVTNGQFCLRRLEGATANPQEVLQAITEIVEDGSRASAVISRIRGLLAKGDAHRTEFDINQTIKDVAMLLRNELRQNRVALRTELAADLPRPTGNSVQLQQVLINLIMNAVEAMRVSTDGRREILIRSAKSREGVVVEVQDSGPGIDPEAGTHIFEPFFTTKATGIGMGLSISLTIIESHGGRIRNMPSATGARFEFTLPTDDGHVS